MRRREGTEAAWDVLVSWAGRHEDSWVARAKLSRPLQKEVRSMLERRRQEAAQGRAQGVEARRAMRAERRGMGRRAAVWRGRLPAEGVRRSGRVRVARAQLEGLEEAESGEEAEEEVSSFQVSYWVDMHVYTPTSGFGHVCTCLQLSARLSAETKLFICRGSWLLLAVSVGHTGQEKTKSQLLPPEGKPALRQTAAI